MTNANEYFNSNSGSDGYYYHPLFKSHFTSGVYDLAESCKAFWLIDQILSLQLVHKVRQESFQVWELVRLQKHTFSLTCSDGNGHPITVRKIPYSNFPYDKATLWFTGNVLLLPSEYWSKARGCLKFRDSLFSILLVSRLVHFTLPGQWNTNNITLRLKT